MATLSTVLTFARAQAQTDSNGLTDARGIIFGNEALVDFHRQLVQHGVDASQLQEAYMTPGVPSAGNGSTFSYPTDMLALKTIEVNYGDTIPGNYRLATQVDVSNLPANQSFSFLRSQGSTTYPQFDDRGDWFEMFPTFTGSTAQVNGIRIFYYLKPTEYTSTSDTISYPESQDMRILGWRIAAMYYFSLNKMAEGEAFNLKYQERVQDYITTLGRGSSQPLQATPLQVSGWQF